MARFDGQRNKQKATKLRIGEVSGVTQGAHDEAHVTLFKSEDFEKVYDLTSVDEGHQHLIDITECTMGYKGGHTSYTDDHSHPFILNADGTITIGLADDHIHTVNMTAQEIFNKQRSGQRRKRRKDDPDYSKNDSSTADGNDGDSINGGNNMAKPTAKATGDDTAAAKLEKRVQFLEKYGNLNDDQKKYYNSLDEDGQTAFLAKSSEEQDKEIEKSRDENRPIYTDMVGIEYFKSDDPRMIANARRNDDLQKDLQKRDDKVETTELEKSASTIMKNYSGEMTVKVAVIKAVNGIEDKDTRLAALKLIESSNNVIKMIGDNIGELPLDDIESQPLDKASAEAKLSELSKALAAKESIEYAVAYDKVLSTSEGQSLYKQAYAA